jgi:hypothetical protein
MTAAPDREAPGAGRVLRLLWPAAACVVGLIFQFHPMFLAGFDATPGDPGDSRLCNDLLEHTFLWAVGRPDHAAFWNLPMFHPVPNVTAYSESLLAVAPVYWFWRTLTPPADTAFQLWLMSMASLNFIGCYLLLRRALAFDPPAASLGSFIYAFGNSRTAQLHHAQLLPAIYSLLALLCLARLLREPTSRGTLWLAAATACLVAQAYASYYLAWTFCFGLGLFLSCCMFDRPCRDAILAIRLTWPSALLCLAAMALSAPLLIHGLAVVRQTGWYPFASLEPLLPRPQSWFYMGRRSWLYFGARNLPLFTAIPAEHEQRIGLGIATTICAAIGLWRQRQRPWVKPLALASAALVVLTTRWPHGVVLWPAVYRLVPGAGGIRGVSRAGLLLLLPAALGVAGWSQRRHRTWLTALAAALCVLEQGYSEPTWPKLQFRAVAERVAAAVPPACGSFYIAMRARPNGDPSAWLHQMDAVSAQIGAGVPTINGYSGHVPMGYEELADNVIETAADERRLRQGFARWTAAWRLTGACFVVVPAPY